MGKTTKEIKTIRDVRPQRRNANKHTQRGLGLLEDSIQQLGWIGAITVAADGETFDGSARVEVGAGAGFEDAIVVESDGTKPIIHRRIDIPTADDPKAVELGIRANRIAQVDLDWDAELMKELRDEGVGLSALFNENELDALLKEASAPTLHDPDIAPNGYKEQYGVIVMCAGEAEQREVYDRLTAEGFDCKVVTT